MDPVPQMVTPAMEIATKCAAAKGVLKIRTAEEADELISQIIIAKTGLLGAASAIGAQGAMDAAREVEAERAEREAQPARVGVPEVMPIPASHYCDSGNCKVCGDGTGDGAPCAESCPGHGLGCVTPAPHDWPHLCPEGCKFGVAPRELHLPDLMAVPPAPPLPLPLDEAVMRLVPMEGSALKAALVDISQSHPDVFNAVVPGAAQACPLCTGLHSDDCSCREDCGVTQCQAADPNPDPDPDGGWPPPCPSCGGRDEHADGCERQARFAAIGAQVRQLSQPAPVARAGRHALAVAR